MVTHAFPRFEGDMAGVFIDLLVRALAKRGHDIHVITPSDAGNGGRIDWHGIAVHRVRYAPRRLERLAHRGTMADAARSPIGALTLLGMVRALRRSVEELVKKEGLDVVHAHWWVPGGGSHKCDASPSFPRWPHHGTRARGANRWDTGRCVVDLRIRGDCAPGVRSYLHRLRLPFGEPWRCCRWIKRATIAALARKGKSP